MSTVAVVVCVGTVVIAQTKIKTVEEYTKIMKSNGELGRAMNQALTVKQSYPEARKIAASLRQNLVAIQPFWAERKREDAVRILQAGLGRIDALDILLATEADMPSVMKASEEFGRTCAVCH
jgi:hypothetical protein